ncbi:Endosome-associated-trafficking regulator 1 [Lemmus lemmus]
MGSRPGAPPLSRTQSLVVPDDFGYGKGKCTKQSPTGAHETCFGELAGPESLPPWTLSDTDSRISPASPAGSPNVDFTALGESLGDRHLRTLQISYEALKDENSKLRRKLTEVQSFSESQTEMVRTLERKLEAKMIKEESDFHDLESVVQQVEQNLELMTKQAVKAENHVLKLKQENKERLEKVVQMPPAIPGIKGLKNPTSVSGISFMPRSYSGDLEIDSCDL